MTNIISYIGSFLKHIVGVLLLCWRRMLRAGLISFAIGAVLGLLVAVISTGQAFPGALAVVVALLFGAALAYGVALTIFLEEFVLGAVDLIKVLEGDVAAAAHIAAEVAEREAGDVAHGLRRLFGIAPAPRARDDAALPSLPSLPRIPAAPRPANPARPLRDLAAGAAAAGVAGAALAASRQPAPETPEPPPLWPTQPTPQTASKTPISSRLAERAADPTLPQPVRADHLPRIGWTLEHEAVQPPEPIQPPESAEPPHADLMKPLAEVAAGAAIAGLGEMLLRHHDHHAAPAEPAVAENMDALGDERLAQPAALILPEEEPAQPEPEVDPAVEPVEPHVEPEPTPAPQVEPEPTPEPQREPLAEAEHAAPLVVAAAIAPELVASEPFDLAMLTHAANTNPLTPEMLSRAANTNPLTPEMIARAASVTPIAARPPVEETPPLPAAETAPADEAPLARPAVASTRPLAAEEQLPDEAPLARPPVASTRPLAAEETLPDVAVPEEMGQPAPSTTPLLRPPFRRPVNTTPIIPAPAAEEPAAAPAVEAPAVEEAPAEEPIPPEMLQRAPTTTPGRRRFALRDPLFGARSRKTTPLPGSALPGPTPAVAAPKPEPVAPEPVAPEPVAPEPVAPPPPRRSRFSRITQPVPDFSQAFDAFSREPEATASRSDAHEAGMWERLSQALVDRAGAPSSPFSAPQHARSNGADPHEAAPANTSETSSQG